MKKSSSRFWNIGFNGLRSVLTPLLSFLLSYLVIRNYSKGLWGDFVTYLLFFFVANMTLNWGGKEFLQRKFSEVPSKIVENWQSFFLARLPVFIIILLVILIFFSWEEFQFLSIWIMAGFVNNAFVPVYVYKRDYGKVILIEMISFLILIVLIFANRIDLDVYLLSYYYAFYCLIKALFFSVMYFSFWQFQSRELNFKLLWLGLPFLTLSLTGFFQSKVDLYVFSFFYKGTLLAEYQILSGFLVFSQSIATILLLPYVKNVYRLESSSIKKLNKLISLSGVFINLIVIFCILVVLMYFFDVRLTVWQALIGYLIGLPSYFYTVRVFYLFKTNRERKVLEVSIYSLLINLILSIILLYSGWSVTGVLLANSAAQVTSLFLYSRYQINDKAIKTH